MNRLLSVPESARFLGGVSPWTIRSWLTQKRLARVKVGRRTMISQRELERFIRQCNGGEASPTSKREKGESAG